MRFEVFATHTFRRSLKVLAKKYRSIKNDLSVLIDELECNPFQGTELTPGIRKIRMAISSKGRGKSGGARIITYTVMLDQNSGEVYLLDIYDKSDISSINEEVIKDIVKDMGLGKGQSGA